MMEEYGTSVAAPMFIKVSAGQVLGSTAVNWKAEPLLQKQFSFADFGGLGAAEQKDVKMKTGQRFKAKGFRYIVQDGVTQYCAFDKDCAAEAVDSCAAGGTCQPLAAEGFELQSSAPAELFGRQGSELHGVGNHIRQWVVSDFASRRENCGNEPGHPAGTS